MVASGGPYVNCYGVRVLVSEQVLDMALFRECAPAMQPTELGWAEDAGANPPTTAVFCRFGLFQTPEIIRVGLANRAAAAIAEAVTIRVYSTENTPRVSARNFRHAFAQLLIEVMCHQLASRSI
jgi:hypothetical protein